MVFRPPGSSLGLDKSGNIKYGALNAGEIDFNCFVTNYVIVADPWNLTQNIKLTEIGSQIKVFQTSEPRMIGRERRLPRLHSVVGVHVSEGLNDAPKMLI